jgi:hypothetical protein
VFFTSPADVTQRRYETLRAYFVEGATASDVAERFGYAASTVVAMVRDFVADPAAFFVTHRPGPRVAPAKQAARAEVLRLRAEGHSVPEITEALASMATPLNRTGVWEICRDEGFERLATRVPSVRRPPLRQRQPRTRVITWPVHPVAAETSYAGLLLLVPALVELDLPAAVAAARMPEPARSPRWHRCCRCWRSR